MRGLESVIVMLGTLGALSVASRQPTSAAVPPGLESYTPTKLEWLQVEAQTELSENAPCYTVNITKRMPDTIVVTVPYKQCMSEQGARVVAVQSAEAVRMIADGHGWKPWLKVEKDVHLLNGDGRD